MKRLKFKTHQSTLLFSLLALAIFTGTMQAAQLQVNNATIALACNSITGPGASATVVVKPVTALTASNTIVIAAITAPTGITVSPNTSQTLNATNGGAGGLGITYTFTAAASCTSFTTGSTTFKFKIGTADDVSVAITTTLNPASNLTVSASSIALTCIYNAGYTLPTVQTVNVTAGSATTVTMGSAPSWLAVGALANAGATPTSFTVGANANCNNLPVGTNNSATLHLVHSTASAMTDKTVAVSLKVVSPTTLLATPSTASLTYAKGSGSPGFADVVVKTGSGTAFFSVDTASLPIWLTADIMSGQVSTTQTKSIRFSSTSVADTLAPGSYKQVVHLKVANQDDYLVTVYLQVNSAAAKLTVSEGQTRNSNWVVGQNVPTAMITMVSSGSAIPYSITTGGPLQPSIDKSLRNGLAYSFGTPVPVTFSADAFSAAQAGSVITGTVSITWGNPSATTVVTFNITVQSPAATLTDITPAALPMLSPGATTTVFLTGTGFIPSTDPSVKTRVGIYNSGFVANANLAANVINPSNIAVTITVPAATDTVLPFGIANGGTVTLAVCNPNGATCIAGANSYKSFSIGDKPNISTITSASSFIQVLPGDTQTVAPYDMVSIFGFNFCPTCGSSQVLYGTPDATTLRYPTILAPDIANPGQGLVNPTNGLKVGFYTHNAVLPTTPIAWAPILFATNNQINLVVPGAVTPSTQVDVYVSFDTKVGNVVTTKTSLVSVLNVVKSNPGVFTIGSDGQGDGAILDQGYAVVGANNPAAARKTLSNSDAISIYMTGLGVPDSDVASPTTFWDKDCTDTATYVSSNSISPSLDGQVVLRSLIPGGKLFAPCFKQSSVIVPSVKIGNVTANVLYAGWVADSIAGLYQVNVQLPSTVGTFTLPDSSTITNITAPTQLPIVVKANNISSQPGVTVWVAPRLKVDPPADSALTGKVGAQWPNTNNSVVASDGASSNYTYAVTGGLLPAGLALNPTTGAITGVPAANTAGAYVITVTATDTAQIPVTGSVTFTLTVTGGLVMTPSGNNTAGTFGTPSAISAAITPTGGTYPYHFAITNPVALPKEMTIDDLTGVVSISDLTPAGTFTITITATDSTPGTHLTGSITFDVVVNFKMTNTAPVAGTNAADVLTTVTATGNSGTIIYTLDPASVTAGFAINSSTGAVTVGTATSANSGNITVTATDSVTKATGASNLAKGFGTGNKTIAVTVN